MKYRNDLKRRVLAGLFAGAALCLAAPAALAANSPVANNQLPAGGHVVAGDATVPDILKPGGNPNGATSATITQNSQNAVIVWDNGFNVGGNATVNFEGPQGGYSTLNYDKGGSMSQIYGTINANNNGNIYIVNPSGVEIGNSAQINVGSLYVSNRNLDDALKNLTDAEKADPNITNILNAGTTTDAALMSLGNINASQVTFDGDRIVIDTERLKNTDGDKKLGADDITILTTNENNVVIGYDAYDEVNGYTGAETKNFAITEIKKDESGKITESAKEVAGYMWVEDVEQLQAINTNLSGNYALRNSIDATATQDRNGTFNPLGGNGSDGPFTGKFDGLDYNIFNLNINRADKANVGLFGVVGDKAVINNVTLVGGSITGGANVGALAGSVEDGAQISNITNSASVTGTSNVGGIAGSSGNANWTGLINTGTINVGKNDDGKSNAGGLIGSMNGGTLGGASYNLGSVTGSGSNVGGLVGYAEHAIIGNEGENAVTVYNRLNVTGAYNVGGIVGNMEDTTVQNAENSGNVKAKEHMDGNYYYHSDVGSAHIANASVWIANVGGIAGKASNSAFANVLNTGNVSSASNTLTENVTNVNGNGTKYVASTYYTAGNVGGIVGSAVDTNITNATNRENEIRGAHNVGGIAGYFTNSNDNDDAKKYTIKNGINDGGDIMATGARYKSNFVKETIRRSNGEHFTIGNMGGIVGYMDGDDVYIASSANRGTVHTLEPEDAQYVGSASQAANAGGIVGKIDRSDRKDIAELGANYADAAVSNSYNTGDVMGYTGIGGVAGMMYNGEIAGSYNLGNLRTTRQSRIGAAGSIDPINMGGIVGDTTEESSAQALLYDVYNKGQIGDANYDYFGRHVGGIVGRLSGAVEKAYNTGAIYNGYNVVGGIAGWMYTGSINNAFNTGNITVVNKNVGAASQVGGIVGAADVSIDDITLSNVYNLGTLRSFWENNDRKSHNSLGGIIGGVYKTYGDHNIKKDSVYIINAYTTGNLYIDDLKNSGMIGSIYTNENSGAHFVAENTYYIQPDTQLKDTFTNLYVEDNPDTDLDNSNKPIAFDQKDNIEQYAYEGHKLFQTETQVGNVNKADDWRIYKGSTPILNAFLPNAENYFSTTDGAMNGIASIQYGTAYDPLLTIIKANGDKADLKFNWQELGINNDAGLAVYGAGLTLNDFMATGGSGYFGGLIYSDGALTIKADTDGGNPHSITGDVALGSASKLYGSSVTIKADGQVTIYGSVTATGNTKDGTTVKEDGSYEKLKNFTTDGRISITGGNVDIYGQLTSGAVGETVKGIGSIAEGWTPGDVSDQKAAMSDIGDRFGYTTSGSAVDGNIAITANDASDGHVNVYYGNQEEGFIDAAGSLSVTAAGDIYMGSDLSIGGDLTLSAGYKGGVGEPAADSEAVLDITNIGQVQANGDKDAALEYLDDFLTRFGTENTITLAGDETKLAVDMWGTDSFNLTKYDYKGKTLADRINKLNLSVNGNGEASGQDYTYIWVSTGEQLAGIQQYYEQETNAGRTTNILGYNFALKNDINASGVNDYKAIASGEGEAYTGTFDGRDNRIIGLDTTKTSNGSSQTLTNAGIFDTIGISKNADGTEQVGTVEDLRVYSGTFHGTNNAGAVAGVNNGTISNVTAFGNVVDVQNTSNGASYAGGIAGTNSGTIDNASAIGTATQSSTTTATGEHAAAGGIAGLNDEKGTISNSTSNSAVNASAGNATALGGAAGVNSGTLENVDSLGVTTGIYKVQTGGILYAEYSDNVGGIAGTNSGSISNAYNESIVSGRDNVGGIIGTNEAGTTVENVSNAASVTGEAGTNGTSDYVGGLAGTNSGTITNGRNNGTITGNQYVGGLVGNNASADSKLENLVNDEAAAITGDNFVGGIAGSNAGTITAIDQQLVNRGSITGQTYVGGVAGVNTKTGIIANTISSIALHVKTPYSDDGDDSNDPKYFGGVVGQNQGTIQGATNESSVDVAADGASMVGGIIGENTETGKLEGTIANKGVVSGKSDVGGIIGSNKNDDILNNSAGADRLIVSNSGLVKAEDGGAAGIFYENTGDINNADLVNTGMVIGGSSKDSVTGGLFGKNSGEISNSTLTNNGTVYGGGTVGGLIGENKGNISHSSLINSTDGEVIGIQNVGGLIGVNTGDIIGGRDENDGYYKYQIYNNGTITVEGNGTNIGGLIGTNEAGATVTAGYNTGVIHADGSSNVGGIAGTNAGTLNQVFNTVITVNEDGSTASGSITGSTNVGGIAGTNSGTGTISNAYNTTGVTGTAEDAVTGFIAGTNSNTAGDSISNVYSTIDDKLVNSDNLVGSGTVSNVYDSEQDAFGDDDSSIHKDGEEAAENDLWRQYGDNNPILKVFLTQLTVNETAVIDGKEISLNDYLNLVYNGKEQDINIQDLIDKGFITGPEGMKDADENSFAFNAYENTSRGPEESNPFGNSDLLYNTDGQKYAGSYENWLASEQIEAGGGTVNNLGYDIDFGALSEGNEINIGKAQIQIDLDTINRVYGNAAIQGTKPAETNGMHFGDDKDYGFTISNDDTRTGLTEGMLKDFENLTMDDLGYEFVSDGALGTGESGKVTNNAGDHTWSANFSLGEDTGETSLAHNYELVGASDQGTVQASGTSHVDRAHLTISANDEQIYVSERPQFSGTVISDVLVNGDTIFDGSYQYGTEYPVDTSKPGSLDPVIGIHFGNTYLNDKSPASDWDNVLNGLFKNYNVEFKPGTLTVQDLPEGMPDISDIPSIERHWNFLFDDNPWDRNRDFRERKAEVHFVAGGMTL